MQHTPRVVGDGVGGGGEGGAEPDIGGRGPPPPYTTQS